MNNEYHKIETIFVRDMDGTKKLIEGQFRNPLVEYLKDLEWIFTEKIDGTNMRIHWDGHAVTISGRTDNAQIHGYLYQKCMDLFGGETNAQIFEEEFALQEVTLIGEGYGPGIQKGGGLYRDDKSFILFDVRVGSTYIDREGVEDIGKALGVDCVPIVLRGTIQQGVDLVKEKGMSSVGTAPREGIVGTPAIRCFDHYGNRMIVKIKVCDF